MILLTGFYEDADPRRQGELLECLRRNVENGLFDEIHVFLEEPRGRGGPSAADPVFAAPKVRPVAHGRRVTYRDLLAYANARLPGRRAVIANADIYFDHTLALLDGRPLAGKLLCLSRWDVQPDGSARLFDHPASQDAWVFEAPIRELVCDFHLGVPGCDNRVALEAERAGLAVSNPSRSIRAHHLHLSQVHRYSWAQRVGDPGRPLPAVFLESPAPGRRGPAPDAPLAAVAFRESMGYTVARLAAGVSSHNNDPRPFASIPEAFRRLPFTQVVAFAVSPVEVTFLTPGKLFVLVGDDWDGSRAAVDWLNDAGFRECLPPLQTERGTGFEAWSLVGHAGERVVIPTQVMLAARELTRADEARRHADPTSGAAGREAIFALTSLPPGRERVPRTRECLRSWRNVGLQVRAFNHPEEIKELAGLYDVEFVPTAESPSACGRHYAPIHAMLDWAAERDVPALLINADIYLRMEPWELRRARLLSEGGVCYFVRYNHNGSLGRAEREPAGIDAFLVRGRDVAGFPRSALCMGQPFWDYWIPHALAARGRPVRWVEFPAAFHEQHARHWSWEEWRRGALEFVRCTGESCGNQSFESCHAMARRVRQSLGRGGGAIPRHPEAIRDWVEHKFGGPEPKTFLELGAHRGTDTEWMSRLRNVTIHAFEPDPRNRPAPRPNVTLHRAAISDRDAAGSLLLSQQAWGREWTESSSIKRPKNHLLRHAVTFSGSVEVELVTLDTFRRRHGLGVIDFIWADIQGAEGEMIRGGRETLGRTRYLYTEYSDDEMYEGQVTLDEMLRLLPDFGVVELWPTDVLLENRNLVEQP